MEKQMNSSIEQSRNVPPLRFPEFQGDWERKKLKEVSTYFNGGSFENDVKEEGKYELITLKSVDMSGNLAHSKRYLDIKVPTLSKNTLIMILSEQSPGLLGMTALIPTDNKYVLNQRVAEIRPNSNVESYFLSMAINRNQNYFSKHGAGTKVQNISKPNVENYSFLCPTLPEQTKIATFLTAVDEKIQALKKKHSLLAQYKKGVMQKLFSVPGTDAINRVCTRFKDENGNDFPDWEVKKLGEIGETYGGLSGKSKENFGKGKPYIQYKQIFDDNKIDISRFGLVDIEENENQNKVHFGDVFFTISSETPTEIGMSSVLLNNVEELYLNSFCFGFRANSLEELNPFFSRYLFRSESFREEIIKLAQGSTRYNMSKIQLLKIEIQMPCFEEQTAIANFLSALDEKLHQTQTQIEKMEAWKKGLLQKMFC